MGSYFGKNKSIGTFEYSGDKYPFILFNCVCRFFSVACGGFYFAHESRFNGLNLSPTNDINWC